MLLVGFGGDVEDEVADFELVVAEEGGVIGANECACHLKELVLSELGELCSEELSLLLLLRGQRLVHDMLDIKETNGAFFAQSGERSFVYKFSTNLRDAHTGTSFCPFLH